MKAFANVVNRQVECGYKPNYVDTKKLYDLCASVQGFVKTFNSDHDGSGALVRRVVSTKAPYLTLRKSNTTQGRGPPGTAGSILKGLGGKPESAKAESISNLVGKGGKGYSKGEGKGGDEHFAQLTLADDFYDANANKMPFISPEEICEGAVGIAQTNTNQAGKFIEALYEQEPFSLPLAIIMTGANFSELIRDQRQLVTRFAPKMIEVPVKRGNTGGLRTTKTILLQLGPHNNHIHFSDPTVTHALANDNHMTKAIVAVRKSTIPDNLLDKISTNPKAFHDYIMTALDVANFCDDNKLRPLRPRDIECGTETTQEVRGFALLRSTKKKQAFYRSGTQGVFIRTAERDEEFIVVNLPIKWTLAEATALHRRLPAGLSEGIVTTAKGYAIRCLPAHKADNAQHVRPEEAETYGDLFSLERDNAAQYIVRGVDNDVTGPMLRRSLHKSIGWDVRPVKPLRSAAWGKRDWIVWAAQDDEPSSNILCLTTEAGTAMRIEIDEQPFKSKSTFWQKIADNLAKRECDDGMDGMDYDEPDRDDDDNNDSQFRPHQWAGNGWVSYTAAEWKKWRS